MDSTYDLRFLNEWFVPSVGLYITVSTLHLHVSYVKANGAHLYGLIGTLQCFRSFTFIEDVFRQRFTARDEKTNSVSHEFINAPPDIADMQPHGLLVKLFPHLYHLRKFSRRVRNI